MMARRVRRPTEDRALARIAREAARKGISQTALLQWYARNGRKNVQAGSLMCHCKFCRRKRQEDPTHRVEIEVHA